MSKQTLSTADTLAVGRGYDPRLHDDHGFKGTVVHLPSLVSLGAPEVEDDDLILDAATGAELPATAGTKTYTAADAGTSPLDNEDRPAGVTLRTAGGAEVAVLPLDVPRNLTVKAAHDTAIVACSVLVRGYDVYGYAMSELFTVTATGTSKTVTGAKAFAYVESVAITAAEDATGNRIDVGTGVKLGLPVALQAKGHCLSVLFDGAQQLVNVASNAAVTAADASAATNATGDVRGTVTITGTLDGVKPVDVWMHVAGRNSRAGLVGVAQA